MARVIHQPELRAEPRFVPMSSVKADILHGDAIVQGVVANLSESGASLVTNEPIQHGANVRLKLSRFRKRLFETEARVVWHANGVDPVKELVGMRQGVSFTAPSDPGSTIRDFLLSPDFDRAAWKEEHAAEHRIDFDLLIDPDIELLFSEELVDVEAELSAIRRVLRPFLQELTGRV